MLNLAKPQENNLRNRKSNSQLTYRLQTAFESCQLSDFVILLADQHVTQSHSVHLLTCLLGPFHPWQLFNLSLSFITWCIGTTHASVPIEMPNQLQYFDCNSIVVENRIFVLSWHCCRDAGKQVWGSKGGSIATALPHLPWGGLGEGKMPSLLCLLKPTASLRVSKRAGPWVLKMSKLVLPHQLQHTGAQASHPTWTVY